VEGVKSGKYNSCKVLRQGCVRRKWKKESGGDTAEALAELREGSGVLRENGNWANSTAAGYCGSAEKTMGFL
jgi:hypothetical protein